MCIHRYILSRYQIMFLSYHSVQLNYFVTLSLTISLGKLPSFKYFRIFSDLVISWTLELFEVINNFLYLGLSNNLLLEHCLLVDRSR